MSDLDWANYTDFKVGSHMTDRDYLVYHYSKEGYARYLYECILTEDTNYFRKPGKIMMSANSLRAERLIVIGKYVVINGGLCPIDFKEDELPAWAAYFRYPAEYPKLCLIGLNLEFVGREGNYEQPKFIRS